MSASRRRSSRYQLAAAALLAAAAWACSSPSRPPAIRLVEDTASSAAYIEVADADAATLRTVRNLQPGDRAWSDVLRVHVVDGNGTPSADAVAGKYETAGTTIRFRPLFPFEAGRPYRIVLAGVGSGATPQRAPVEATVSLPAAAPTPPTSVTQVFPSGDVMPENQLRMYIHFSAPMGRRGGIDYVKLLDEAGRQVEAPFLPLDAEFWNGDRTRYTVFFDPGRQKRGILPNRTMGRSLVPGKTYTFVVDREWLDGHGKPLRETFQRKFRIGPADESPLDHSRWRVTPPLAGTRDVLTVTFPEPLDHGLLLRAIGVRRDGRSVAGDVRVEAGETRWTMTPTDAWQPGKHELIALSILEDRAGNRIGRAFEVDSFERVDQKAEAEITSIPFTVAANGN